MRINAENLPFEEINRAIRESKDDCVVENCLGQRFIGAGMSDINIEVRGIAGNALGAYLNGASLTVYSNAQDAVGDTMNEGIIKVFGNIGDAAGYAMRGGRIYVKGNAGYRAGIHMKAYRDKSPVMIIGGKAGSFLGEYQAGGTIVVLNLEEPETDAVGDFACTGMHGGKMFIRCSCIDKDFPPQVTAGKATEKDIEEIRQEIVSFCRIFGYDPDAVLSSEFTVITPDSSNPYRQMYVEN